jgi:N-acetylmuramoyl-L-alanine amidase
MFLGFSSLSQVKSKAIERIIIDPGHGGKDSGNKGTGRYKIYEKDIVLEVSKKVGKLIEKNLEGVKVFYTRTSDSYPTLAQRAAFANKKKGDLYISIHCDAFDKEHVHGSSCLVLGKNHTTRNRIAIKENGFLTATEGEENINAALSKKGPYWTHLYQSMYLENSVKLGDKIQTQFRDGLKRKDRGVKHQPLHVIRAVSMPAVLIELGFLTNKKEEDFLNSSRGKDLMASAIYRAVKAYKKEQDAIWSAVSENNNTEYAPPPLTGTYYCIQLMASKSKLKSFKGLDPVEVYQEKGMYKYLYGHAVKYDDAKKLQAEARKAGYTGAFIVGMKKGKKVPAKDLKL